MARIPGAVPMSSPGGGGKGGGEGGRGGEEGEEERGASSRGTV